MRITKIFKFEMAHKLHKSYTCKCMNIHGHSYKVHVTLEGKVNNKSGVVTDFTKLKEVVSEIFDNLDHNCMVAITDTSTIEALKTLSKNGSSERFVICSVEPTAENIGLYLTNRIAGLCKKAGIANLEEVKVFETETSIATITVSDLDNCKHIPEMSFYNLKDLL